MPRMGGNAYYDGTNWMRFDVAQPAVLLGAAGGQVTVVYTAAGANPISWGATAFAVNASAGPMTAAFDSDTASARLKFGPAYGIVQTVNGGLYLRSSSSQPVIIDAGAGGSGGLYMTGVLTMATGAASGTGLIRLPNGYQVGWRNPQNNGDSWLCFDSTGRLQIQIGVPGIFVTNVGGAGGAQALPATPAGYMTVTLDGSAFKIPYYPV